MHKNSVNMTVADYCAAFERGEVVVNRRYQRSPDVWPAQARSYLIETLLKGFPIPKLTLHQVTDLKSRKTIKYVVDGQQRTRAILDYFNGSLRLSRSLELEGAGGKLYEKLDEDLQQAFLSYSLDFDQFEAATDDDVREYFRRINSFTAPLNAEEQRHARFQGPMKWFIHDLAGDYGNVLVNLGTLANRGIVRMADAKLLAEVVHALKYGVTTTKKQALDKMYKDNDKGDSFEGQDEIKSAIGLAFDQILRWQDLHETGLMRPHMLYSLLLAVVRVRRDWTTLNEIGDVPERATRLHSSAQGNLLSLAASIEVPEDCPEELLPFLVASTQGTNVKDAREERIAWMAEAMVSKSI